MAAPKLPGGSGDDEADSASAAAAEERDAAVDDRERGEARASLDGARRVPRSDARECGDERRHRPTTEGTRRASR